MLMSPMRDGTTTSKDRATQLFICEPLSFTIPNISRMFVEKLGLQSLDRSFGCLKLG